MNNKTKAFTLIELMIVIAILSILIVVLIPNFVMMRSQAKLIACQSNLKNLSTAIENYASSNNDSLPNSDFIIDQSSPIWNYISTDIKCPLLYSYYEYKIESSSKYYIYCPTINNSKKHKTKRGNINKLFIDNQNGIQLIY